MTLKFVKHAFSVAMILVSLTSVAQQRQIGTPEERASRQTARMKETLQLSPDQESSVAAINLNYAKQAQSLLETGGRNLKTAREARSMMKRKDDELEKVLSKDQFKQYQDIKEEMRDAMKERRRQRP